MARHYSDDDQPNNNGDDYQSIQPGWNNPLAARGNKRSVQIIPQRDIRNIQPEYYAQPREHYEYHNHRHIPKADINNGWEFLFAVLVIVGMLFAFWWLFFGMEQQWEANAPATGGNPYSHPSDNLFDEPYDQPENKPHDLGPMRPPSDPWRGEKVETRFGRNDESETNEETLSTL